MILRILVLAMLLVPLAGAQVFELSTSNANFRIDNTNIYRPLITVNYTQPVVLSDGSNILSDGDEEYGLKQISPTQGAYAISHQFIVTEPNSDTSKVLLPGNYTLTLIGFDQQGKPTTPDPADSARFTIDGLDMRITSPTNGIAGDKPYDVVISTPSDAVVCNYSFAALSPNLLQPMEEGSVPSYTHTIRDVTYRDSDLYLLCLDGQRQVPGHFRVGYDLTAPVLSVVARPANVTDPRYKWAAIGIDSDDASECSIDDIPLEDGFLTHREKLIYYNSIQDTNPHDFSYLVACTNKAGRSATKRVNVTVNLGLFQSISVLSPGQITNKTSFDLKVQPTFQADACTVNGYDMTLSNGIFSLPFAAPGIAEGNNKFEIACTGEKSATRNYTVLVDSTPPPAPSVRASPYVCGATIRADIESTDTGIKEYRYQVRDNGGLIAQNTTIASHVEIRLTRAASGDIVWGVRAVDRAGNVGPENTTRVTPQAGQDEQCGLPVFIRLVRPPLGYATQAPYTVELETLRQSECRYALTPGISFNSRTPFSSTDHTSHTATFQFEDQDLFVACRELGDDTMHYKTFALGIDDTPPKMSILAQPNPVVDFGTVAVLSVTTDDKTYCTYNGKGFSGVETDPSTYTRSHSTTLDYRSITQTDPFDEKYSIACTNLARLRTTASYTVQINLGMAFDIVLVSPSAFTSEDPITLSVRPTKNATMCQWKTLNGTYESLTPGSGGIFSTTLGSLPEGTYQYKVSCTGVSDIAEKIVGFTVDRSIPLIEDLRGPGILCSAEKYYFNISSVDQSPRLAYSLEGIGGVEFQENTTDPYITIDPAGIGPGDYTLKLIATSGAGLSSEAATLPIEIRSTGDPACSLSPDHCSNGVLDPGEEHLDCGGTCGACQLCVDSLECTSGTCLNGVCVENVPATCSNGVLDPGEEHVDCGGSCGACQVCLDDLDCPGKTCEDGLCVAKEPSGCTSNSDCGPDQICWVGQCEDKNPPPPPSSTEQTQGTDWTAIIILLLGLAIMGGAGYFLYDQHEKKRVVDSSPRMPPPSTSAPPQQERTVPIDTGARAQRAQQREEGRKKTLSVFGDTEESTGSVQKMPPEKDAQEYVELDKVKTKKAAKKTTKKDEDVFDELDRI